MRGEHVNADRGLDVRTDGAQHPRVAASDLQHRIRLHQEMPSLHEGNDLARDGVEQIGPAERVKRNAACGGFLRGAIEQISPISSAACRRCVVGEGIRDAFHQRECPGRAVPKLPGAMQRNGARACLVLVFSQSSLQHAPRLRRVACRHEQMGERHVGRQLPARAAMQRLRDVRHVVRYRTRMRAHAVPPVRT